MKRPFAGEELTVVALPGEGPGPRTDSAYTRVCWLPIVGPSTVLIAAALARAVEHEPAPVRLSLDELGRCLGLRGRGNDSPLRRGLYRTVGYGLAQQLNEDAIGVRTHVPLVPARHYDRLPERVIQSPEFRLWHTLPTPSPERTHAA